MELDLSELRKEIDAVDEDIVRLFCRRMEISKKVSDYKAQRGLPVLDAARERQKLVQVTSFAGAEMESYICTLYNAIFELSRAEQEKRMHPKSDTVDAITRAIEETPKMFPAHAAVACQGTEGAYSALAAQRLFQYPQLSYYERWEDVFEAIDCGACTYGVLPLENSNAGSVTRVYDLMMRYHVRIVRSTRIHIDHQLLAKPGIKLSEIREIFSHPQAIAQSQEYLTALGVKVTPCENTAQAAKMVANSPRQDVAALASRSCASLYGLQPLASSVQDNGNNHTRFICISKNTEIYPGADRTSIMVVTPHRPGALYQVMSRFNALGINLIKLESRPIPDRDFEFMFYFDLDVSVYAPQFLQLMGELEHLCDEFRYLGSYSEIV